MDSNTFLKRSPFRSPWFLALYGFVILVFLVASSSTIAIKAFADEHGSPWFRSWVVPWIMLACLVSAILIGIYLWRFGSSKSSLVRSDEEKNTRTEEARSDQQHNTSRQSTRPEGQPQGPPRKQTTSSEAPQQHQNISHSAIRSSDNLGGRMRQLSPIVSTSLAPVAQNARQENQAPIADRTPFHDLDEDDNRVSPSFRLRAVASWNDSLPIPTHREHLIDSRIERTHTSPAKHERYSRARSNTDLRLGARSPVSRRQLRAAVLENLECAPRFSTTTRHRGALASDDHRTILSPTPLPPPSAGKAPSFRLSMMDRIVDEAYKSNTIQSTAASSTRAPGAMESPLPNKVLNIG